MNERFSCIARKASDIAGHWAASVAASLLVILWTVGGVLAGFSDFWMLIINTLTTIVTFQMVFLIQNAQNQETNLQHARDDAMHKKLDEIIRAVDKADDELIGIEKDVNDTEKT